MFKEMVGKEYVNIHIFLVYYQTRHHHEFTCDSDYKETFAPMTKMNIVESYFLLMLSLDENCKIFMLKMRS